MLKMCQSAQRRPRGLLEALFATVITFAALGLLGALVPGQASLASAEAAQVADRNPACLLAKDSGRCRASKFKFHFNSTSNRCELFPYGGCGGNRNRFDSLQECHSACRGFMEEPKEMAMHLASPTCGEPPLMTQKDRPQGPTPLVVECRGFFPKFTFDTKAMRCVRYIYGGCNGGPNLYQTFSECATACIRGADLYFALKLGGPSKVNVTGPAQPRRKEPQRSSFRAGPQAGGPGEPLGVPLMPPMKPLGDSKGSGAICKLPPQYPHLIACKARIPKWTFDARQGECRPFVYSGCHGTDNLFSTESDCKARCLQGDSVEQEALDDGRCKDGTGPQETDASSGNNLKQDACNDDNDVYVRYYFDQVSRRCGPRKVCGKNGGNDGKGFDSVKDCVKKCCPSDSYRQFYDDNGADRNVSVCALALDMGPCKAHVPAFGFSRTTGRCEYFIYGGCKGNGNRFASLEECVDTCGGINAAESNPAGVGPGGLEDNPSPRRPLGPSCSMVQCSRNEAMLMEAKGCLPVVKPDECCPSSWDCSLWELRKLRPRECFVASSPIGGKFYAIGQRVPEADQGCRVACTCREGVAGNLAEIACAMEDCSYHFGPLHPPGQPESNQECFRVYDNPKACCATSEVCYNLTDTLSVDEEDNAGHGNGVSAPSAGSSSVPGAPLEMVILPYACQLDGVDYIQGELMYPKDDDCRVCHCRPGFNSSLSDEYCFTVDCGLSVGDKLSRDCVPVFREGVCCPVDWVCPPLKKSDDLPDEGSQQEVVEVEEDHDGYEDQSRLFASGRGNYLNPCPPGVRPLEGPLQKDLAQWDADLKSLRNLLVDRSVSGGGNGDTTVEAGTTLGAVRAKHIPRASGDCLLPRANYSRLCQVNNNDDLSADLWYFDLRARDCRPFRSAGGLLGTMAGLNAFASSDECRQVCDRFMVDSVPPLKARHGFRSCQEATLDLEEALASPADETGGTNCSYHGRHFMVVKGQGRCMETTHLGCVRNHDRAFSSLEACEAKCGQGAGGQPTEVKVKKSVPGRHPDCQLPVVVGPCRGSIKRYYYDPSSGGSCNPFFYGGCFANGNNFFTKEACVDKCVWSNLRAAAMRPEDLEVRDPCRQPVRPGPCKALQPKYFFDAKSGACKPFLYGGCDGNGNRFDTKDLCAATCAAAAEEVKSGPAQQADDKVCHLPVEPGQPCTSSGAPPSVQWHYSSESGRCEAFDYQGCDGNGNRFSSPFVCLMTCVVEAGLGSPEVEVRFGEPYFRGRSMIGGPMGPNQVMGSSFVRNPSCSMPPETGRCRAYIPSFHYDETSGKCQQFVYGGCGGNGNRFESRAECEANCVAPKSDVLNVPRLLPPLEPDLDGTFAGVDKVCGQPPDPGFCRAFFQKYHFNAKTGRCEVFIYGGCRGNGNRFDTVEECQKTCLQGKAMASRLVQPRSGRVQGPAMLTEDGPLRPDTCSFGGFLFHRGDVVRSVQGGCRVCTCSSPPFLTCVQKVCEEVEAPPAKDGCEPVHDQDGCCGVIGYKCPHHE